MLAGISEDRIFEKLASGHYFDGPYTFTAPVLAALFVVFLFSKHKSNVIIIEIRLCVY